ncbi:hypothetical protein [Micromonospora sp. RTGN7]|uniref:hypothetical protein n=1 Tax=Micromonospora sp. RTGN7 TaxID=3016526 RepID=UPI0029FF2BA4|nr:hypothetical protein [Micromonospora sp. RTGN7]
MTDPEPTGPVPNPPARQPFPTPPTPASNATRHLCVGAYLDEDFQRASLNEVYHQRRRLIAPSYGFDLIAVLGQCLQARRLAVIRDAAIVVVLGGALCAAPLAMTFVIGLLITLYLFTSSWQVVRDTARELRRGRSASAGVIVGRAVVMVFRIVAALTISFVLSTLTAGVALVGLAGSREDDGTSGSLSSMSLALAPVTTVGLLVFALGAPIAANILRQSQLERLAPGCTPPAPARSERFDEIRRQESGNTVVFAGYRPFVGSGVLVKNWGFAQRLVRAGDPLTGLAPEANREFDTAPFSAVELLAHLRDNLGRLATEQEPEQQLPGLTVDDRVFLAGTEVAHLVPYTDPAHLPGIIRHPTAPLRHYLVCQVISWRGELVTTVYVHVAVQGRALYMEFTSTALPPCDERFRVVDQVGGTGPAAFFRAGIRGLLYAPGTIGRAPLNLVRAGIEALSNSLPGSNGPTRLGYDYGARSSVRELGMAADTRHHLQTQEVDKHQRIIERRLLAVVLDFLERRGVDTSEYRQRATTLLNAGAIVTGGNLTVQGDVHSSQTNNPPPGEGAKR